MNIIYGVIYFIMCFLQPICLPLPETATVLLGSEFLGAFASFVIGWLGVLCGISAMYGICKKGSAKFLKRLTESGGVARYKNHVKENEILITGLLFIIPVLPDEVICLGAAVIGISFHTFMMIAVFSKFVSIIMIAYSEVIGTAFGMTKWQIIVVELVILFVAAYIMKRREVRRNGGQTVKEPACSEN